MAQQVINLGTIPGDHTGTKGLRLGGDMINDNFAELYAALGGLTGDVRPCRMRWTRSRSTGVTSRSARTWPLTWPCVPPWQR